jgi:hypothetical protein
MSLDTFNKGGSVGRTITLTDGTNALDTADFTTIEVKVFNKLHRGISTYTLAAGTVSRLIPTTNGQVFFAVPETESAQIRALKYYIQITTTELDANYPNGIRTRTTTIWGFDLKVAL